MDSQLMEAIEFLTMPFLMCLLLVGIHCYLGLHVLARGVIFVDLSLAQVAALGATVAMFFGLEGDSTGTYFVSLAATFFASGLFAIARRYENIFSQEAIIGVVYALGSAAVVLIVDRMAHGSEHIKELLIGKVLWVSRDDIVKTAIIYSGVGLVHAIFYKKFIALSMGQDTANSGMWDFLFYCLFGVVITSSVRIAGVLQVFSFLIVPALVSSIYFKSILARLAFGWALGLVLCFIGMAFSYLLDFPSGAFIVVCFTIVPVLIICASVIQIPSPLAQGAGVSAELAEVADEKAVDKELSPTLAQSSVATSTQTQKASDSDEPKVDS